MKSIIIPFKKSYFLTLFYRCSSCKPQLDLQLRKQFHKRKPTYKVSNNTKQHRQPKGVLMSILMPLGNPIFLPFGVILRFSSMLIQRKSAISISSNYRKGQQPKNALNSKGKYCHPEIERLVSILLCQNLVTEVIVFYLVSFDFTSYLSY